MLLYWTFALDVSDLLIAMSFQLINQQCSTTFKSLPSIQLLFLRDNCSFYVFAVLLLTFLHLSFSLDVFLSCVLSLSFPHPLASSCLKGKIPELQKLETFPWDVLVSVRVLSAKMFLAFSAQFCFPCQFV